MNADSVIALAGVWLLFGVVVYVWTAFALAAVFRKAGLPAWQAWVPVLNLVVFLQLAGMSGWLALLFLVPVAGWVVLIIASHRVGEAFGFGAGMTVLAALLFPVWATIVGFGSSRWVGAPGHGVPGRSPMRVAGVDLVATSPHESRAPAHGRSTYAPPAGSRPVPRDADDDVSADEPELPWPFAHETAPPRHPTSVLPVPDVPPLTHPGVVDPPPGGWTPPPLPAPPAPSVDTRETPVAAGVTDADAAAAVVSDDDGGRWEGFSPDAASATGEVTAAEPGAPAPISAVPLALREPEPQREHSDQPRVVRTPPPVERTDPTDSEREPWAPRASEPEAFPETSGPVSAIAGAPIAGGPRSALSSVSAQNRSPQIPVQPPVADEAEDAAEPVMRWADTAEPVAPSADAAAEPAVRSAVRGAAHIASPVDDVDDALDQTVIARRRRTQWALVLPGAEPVALGAEVVLLGRRPAARPDEPGAQLVSIDDPTVSKTHARLVLRGDKWYVTDLDSTNGIVFPTVLGTDVEATPGEEYEAGDRFMAGDAEIRLTRTDE